MTVELLQKLSLAAYIVAGVFLLLAIALFFLLDVPKLYGDISGRTAKKAIKAIRQQNESTGNKAYKPSAVNAERGRLTDKITESGKLRSQTSGLPVSIGTEKFATSMLYPQSNETTVLEQPSGETTVLVNNEVSPRGNIVESMEFTVDVEMSFTGSSEMIE